MNRYPKSDRLTLKKINENWKKLKEERKKEIPTSFMIGLESLPNKRPQPDSCDHVYPMTKEAEKIIKKIGCPIL